MRLGMSLHKNDTQLNQLKQVIEDKYTEVSRYHSMPVNKNKPQKHSTKLQTFNKTQEIPNYL